MMISDILQKLRGESNQVPQSNWQDVARNNPNVQAWWSQMTQRDPRLAQTDMIQFMQNDPSQYNYRESILKGLFPAINPQFGHYHWSDYGKGQNFKVYGEDSPRQ